MHRVIGCDAQEERNDLLYEENWSPYRGDLATTADTIGEGRNFAHHLDFVR
jgi:hypothetical protein